MVSDEPNNPSPTIEYGHPPRGRPLKDHLALGICGILFGAGYGAFLFWWVLFRK